MMGENQSISINDVFKTQGQPTITYVNAKNGAYEKMINQAIDEKGVLCLLTGPSKTGKTTLYTRVIENRNLQKILIRCDNTLNADEIWKLALEQVNFEQVNETIKTSGSESEIAGKISGKLGWEWLQISQVKYRQAPRARNLKRKLEKKSWEKLVQVT